jgi:hypothetical protein
VSKALPSNAPIALIRPLACQLGILAQREH